MRIFFASVLLRFLERQWHFALSNVTGEMKPVPNRCSLVFEQMRHSRSWLRFPARCNPPTSVCRSDVGGVGSLDDGGSTKPGQSRDVESATSSCRNRSNACSVHAWRLLLANSRILKVFRNRCWSSVLRQGQWAVSSHPSASIRSPAVVPQHCFQVQL